MPIRPYTAPEISRIRAMAKAGKTSKETAKALKRSHGALRYFACTTKPPISFGR